MMFGNKTVRERWASYGYLHPCARHGEIRRSRRSDATRSLRLESLEERYLLTVIVNASFESGDFTGWITQDVAAPFEMLRVAQSGDSLGVIPVSSPMFTTLKPTDGAFAATHGFDGSGPGVIRIAQDITVSDPIISFDYRAEVQNELGASKDRRFDVKVDIAGGGANLITANILTIPAGTTLPDTGNLTGSIDLSPFIGQTVRLSFEFFVPEEFTGQGAFQLDNIRTSGGSDSLPRWQNPRNPADVDDSGTVTALDALLIINALSRARSSSIDLENENLLSLPRYPDVSGDGKVTALDALRVLNALARLSRVEQSIIGEGDAATVGVDDRIQTVENQDGSAMTVTDDLAADTVFNALGYYDDPNKFGRMSQ